MTATLNGQAPSLGQILLSQGLVSEAQIENAVNEQRRTRARLGQVLITSGACSEEDIARALARQLHLPPSKADAAEVDKKLVPLLGEHFLREHLCLPLKSEGTATRIAVADPFDIPTSEEIQRKLGRAVLLEIATPRAIIAALDVVGNQDCQIESIIADAQARADEAGPNVSRSDLISADEIVRSFVATGIRRGSADIHVEPEGDLLRIRYRVDGILTPGPMIPKEMISAVVTKIKILSNLDISERRLPQDGRSSLEIDGRVFDLRISILPTVDGECVVMRVLDSSKALIDEDQMGLSPRVAEFMRAITKRPHGLFLVTGPTGSGKSTTLYSMLSWINALERKVVTVEDPVEYRLPLIRQVQVHPDIGLTFAAGLRSILRQDPDVILLGEIRDSETAEIAMRAAMTGHLVLSTLHTNTALGAIARLTDIGIDPYLITSTLCGVVGQRLIRTLCARCAEAYVPRQEEIERFDPSFREHVKSLFRPRGCPFCHDSGFKGRTGVHEALAMSDSLRHMVMARATEEEMFDQARGDGFRHLHLDGQVKVIEGVTTLDEVERVVLDIG